MDITNNTVSAENQMRNSSEVSFLGNPNAKTKILVLGNSITRHGPLKEIGWERDWGMAASAPEKDFVHRLFAKLTEDGQDVFMRIRQAASWEIDLGKGVDLLSRFDEDKAFQEDIILFCLGENITGEEQKADFKSKLTALISYIAKVDTKIIFSNCFWKNDEVDEIIMEEAQSRAAICVDIRHKKDSEMALEQYWHKGVSMHPSDEGMEMIADTFFNVLKK